MDTDIWKGGTRKQNNGRRIKREIFFEAKVNGGNIIEGINTSVMPVLRYSAPFLYRDWVEELEICLPCATTLKLIPTNFT